LDEIDLDPKSMAAALKEPPTDSTRPVITIEAEGSSTMYDVSDVAEDDVQQAMPLG
jgi:hypothetical protein